MQRGVGAAAIGEHAAEVVLDSRVLGAHVLCESGERVGRLPVMPGPFEPARQVLQARGP